MANTGGLDPVTLLFLGVGVVFAVGFLAGVGVGWLVWA